MSSPADGARAFLVAMSTGDGERVTELAAPGIVVVLGPHEVVGVDEVRRLAEQEADLMMEVDPVEVREDGEYVVVDAIRRQRWRATGEVANEDRITVTIALSSDGSIARVELRPAE
jgi:SnoaL-like domain